MSFHALSTADWNQLSLALAGSLWRATWQGAAIILVIALVCRVCPRLPAPVRCWLWWLASVKLLLSLFLAAIPLAILPCSTPPVASVIGRSLPDEHRLFFPAVPVRLDPATGREMFAPAARVVANKPSRPMSSRQMSRQGGSWSPAEIMVAAWLASVLATLFLSARGSLWTGRIVRRAQIVPLPDFASDVAGRLGVRVPRVAVSDEACSVFVTGLLRPAIVVPQDRWDSLSPDEIRMALAHEMAHLRRRDLWLGLVPSAARILFFFHPLAWLAFREYSASREEACDRLAIAATGAQASSYGRLLVKMATSRALPANTGVLAMSPTFRVLRRRIVTLGEQGGRLAVSTRLGLAISVVIVAVVMAPWRLVTARAGHAAQTARLLAPQFVLSDLGSPGPGDIGAVAMSAQGQLAATAQTDNGDVSYAYIVTPTSDQPLRSLPRYAYCRANAINSAGLVAASSYNRCEHNHAFVWEPGGHVRLRGWRGFIYSKALAINDLDQVAGYVQSGRYFHGERVSRAALWTADRDRARAQDLGTLGGPYSAAMALNNLGQVVGKADTQTPHQTHAFLWQSGAITDLGALPDGMNSEATAINDQGDVVGCSQTADLNHAFLWHDGQMVDLGTLPGAGASLANSINDFGEIVGQAVQPDDARAASHAVLWASGRTYDLNSLVKMPAGWVLETATTVTNSGQIAGIGLYHGKPRMFVLTPSLPPTVKA